jgi:hypothetical protein
MTKGSPSKRIENDFLQVFYRLQNLIDRYPNSPYLAGLSNNPRMRRSKLPERLITATKW